MFFEGTVISTFDHQNLSIHPSLRLTLVLILKKLREGVPNTFTRIGHMYRRTYLWTYRRMYRQPQKHNALPTAVNSILPDWIYQYLYFGQSAKQCIRFLMIITYLMNVMLHFIRRIISAAVTASQKHTDSVYYEALCYYQPKSIKWCSPN